MKQQELNEEVFQTSFENALVPLYILDDKYCFKSANIATCDLLGYPHHELQGKDLRDLFIDVSEYDEVVDCLEKEDETVSRIVRLRKSSRGEIKCDFLIRKLYSNDRQGYDLHGTIRNITDIVDREEEILFHERLIVSRQIARSMGHEIRNPLTNLTLALDQLSEEMVDNPDNQLFFDIINRNAQRIEKIISNMLESTKVNEIILRAENINQLISTWVESHKKEDYSNGVKIDLNLNDDVPSANVDYEKLAVAFGNILKNGFLAVKTRVDKQLTISSSFNVKEIIISVEDNGIGIADENISKVFSPFFACDGKWGEGLGLTEAKNIIDSHEGRIAVRSKYGQGSTFSIILRA